MQSAIYRGEVLHHRTGAHGEHRFAQRLPWFSFWLDEMPELGRLRLLAVNGRGPFALNDADHGARDSSPWSAWLDATLAQRGLQAADRYQALCLPRMLGYVFNPITVVFAYDAVGDAFAVVYEVHSTFGESQAYVHALGNAGEAGAAYEHDSRKALHVSPFFSMEGAYRFRVTLPSDRFALGIHYDDADGGHLFAGFRGERASLTDRALLALLIRAPFTAVGVTLSIHWQALLLWCKGMPFYRKPSAAAQDATGAAYQPGGITK